MLTPGKKTLSRLVLSLISALAIAGCAGAPLNTRPAHGAGEAAPARTPLSLAEVVALSEQGVASDVLIARIRDSGAQHKLSAADVISLRDRGVPLSVIDYLLTPDRYPAIGKMEDPEKPTPPAAPRARPIPALYLGV